MNIKRVLIVDDNQHIRESLRIYVSTIFPHTEIMEANNGRHALHMISLTPPHLILIDIFMPYMNGLQAIPRIKVLCPIAKIIALTVDGRQRQMALDAGADAFLVKGTSLNNLKKAIYTVFPNINIED